MIQVFINLFAFLYFYRGQLERHVIIIIIIIMVVVVVVSVVVVVVIVVVVIYIFISKLSITVFRHLHMTALTRDGNFHS